MQAVFGLGEHDAGARGEDLVGEVMQCEPPPAAAELESFDCDHFDAGLAQRGVGADVALLSDDYAGSERNHIVAIVPARARPRGRPRRSGRSAPGNPPTIWNSTGRCLSETVNMTMAFAIVSHSAVNLGLVRARAGLVQADRRAVARCTGLVARHPGRGWDRQGHPAAAPGQCPGQGGGAFKTDPAVQANV